MIRLFMIIIRRPSKEKYSFQIFYSSNERLHNRRYHEGIESREWIYKRRDSEGERGAAAGQMFCCTESSLDLMLLW